MKCGRALLPHVLPIIASMAVEDQKRFSLLPENLRQPAWDEALKQLEAEGVPVPRDRVRTYEDYAAYLADHDIEFPERIKSLLTALTVIDTRERLYNSAAAKDIGRDRPILVMVGARVDENGALEARQFPTLDKAVKSGRFDVLYFEADTDTAVERILTDVHDLTGRRIHTLMLDAHGSRQSLAMGDESQNADNDDIDTGDIERDGAFNFLNEYLDPKGQIILLGCSNGAPMPLNWERFCQEVEWAAGLRAEPPDPTAGVPEFDYFNLAQAFSHLAPGRPVYSSKVPTNLLSFSFDPETLRPRIKWMGNREYVALAGLEQYFALQGRLDNFRRAADRTFQSGFMVASVNNGG
jgi:hypothetical protein